MKDTNFILESDSYKLGSHWNMTPPTITNRRSYGESRVGALYPTTLLYGLQGMMLNHLVGSVVTKDDLDEAVELSMGHFGRNAINMVGWNSIINDHGGRLPIRIRALKEGTLIPVGNAMFVTEATDEKHAWLPQYIEGILMKIWRPSTIATKTYYTKEIIKKYVAMTCDDMDFHRFAFHDFSYRSGTVMDDSHISGSAMLINTYGTDTPSAMKYVHDYYGASYRNLAFSCAATEHSVSMSFGEGQGEYDYLNYQLDQYPDGIISIVSDTYNITNFVENVIRQNRDKIINRWKTSQNPMTKMVSRPDSLRFKGDTPAKQCLWLINTLGEIFGHTPNKKGYKKLHPAVGGIYGDGLTVPDIEDIYSTLAHNNWDVSCLVVGQGGGALESKRDTQRTAIKPCQQFRNGVWEDVVKNPLDVSKTSKTGNLKVINVDGVIQTINQHDPRYNSYDDMLELVFEDGELKRFQTFEEIRTLAGFFN